MFLVGTGFHHVGQAGLELLASRVPSASASASQSAGIIDESHCTQLEILLLTGQSDPTSLHFALLTRNLESQK